MNASAKLKYALIPIVPILIIAAVFIFLNSSPSHPIITEMIKEGRIEFLTTNPTPFDEPNPNTIGNYPILDSRVIDDPALVKKMLKGLIGSLKEEYAEACIFSPRHAVRMIDDKEKFILICFQCQTYEASSTLGHEGRLKKRKKEFFDNVVSDLEMKSPYEENDAAAEPKTKDVTK